MSQSSAAVGRLAPVLELLRWSVAAAGTSFCHLSPQPPPFCSCSHPFLPGFALSPLFTLWVPHRFARAALSSPVAPSAPARLSAAPSQSIRLLRLGGSTLFFPYCFLFHSGAGFACWLFSCGSAAPPFFLPPISPGALRVAPRAYSRWPGRPVINSSFVLCLPYPPFCSSGRPGLRVLGSTGFCALW